MALAVHQSLFVAGGGTPMVDAGRWVEGVMIGEIALVLCVIAVAFIGALMLTGRLPLRKGTLIVIGCFVVSGAPVIAAGIVGDEIAMLEASVTLPKVAAAIENPRPDLPPANFDPHAGASLRED